MIQNCKKITILLLAIIIINSQDNTPSSVQPEIVVQTVPPKVVSSVQSQQDKIKGSQNITEKQVTTDKKQQIQLEDKAKQTSSQQSKRQQSVVQKVVLNISEVSNTTQKVQQNKLIDQTHDHLANLSAQSQQKLLQQVDILQKIHENPQLRLSNLANLTQDQRNQLQRTFAQQSRLNYQKIQKEIQQKQKKQKSQDQWLIRQARLTKTNQFRLKQKVLFDTISKQWLYSKMSHKMNEYMFVIDEYETQDFMIMLPVDQPIYLQLSLYINKQGVYSRTIDIQDQGPLSVSIYQNNSRLISEKQIYFQSNFYVEGRANSIYTIKFRNMDIARLVAFDLSILLQNSHVAQVLSVNDVSNHDDRVDRLYNELEIRYKSIDSTQILQQSNQKILRQNIHIYFSYTIFQILTIMAVGFIQVEIINRLLNQSSVV